MTLQSISFTAILDKYIIYSEALSQYHSLEEEDQKIIEPYISRLKEAWQHELTLIKTRLSELAPKKSRSIK